MIEIFNHGQGIHVLARTQGIHFVSEAKLKAHFLKRLVLARIQLRDKLFKPL